MIQLLSTEPCCRVSALNQSGHQCTKTLNSELSLYGEQPSMYVSQQPQEMGEPGFIIQGQHATVGFFETIGHQTERVEVRHILKAFTVTQGKPCKRKPSALCISPMKNLLTSNFLRTVGSPYPTESTYSTSRTCQEHARPNCTAENIQHSRNPAKRSLPMPRLATPEDSLW